MPLCTTEREAKEGGSQEAFPLSPGVLELGRDDQVSALAAFPPCRLTLIDPLIHSTNIYQTPTTCQAFFQALGIQQITRQTPCPRGKEEVSQ